MLIRHEGHDLTGLDDLGDDLKTYSSRRPTTCKSKQCTVVKCV